MYAIFTRDVRHLCPGSARSSGKTEPIPKRIHKGHETSLFKHLKPMQASTG
jgi:hypothetical protein